MRWGLVVLAAFLVSCGGAAAGRAGSWTKTDVTITAHDGVKLASTVYVPTGTAPAGGWPAVVLFHGLGGTRASMNTIAEQTFANDGYVVLTSDHRGHGESGGLFDVDGPDEVQDAADLYGYLAKRGDVNKAKVGAWGISLGGGVVWGALEHGVPFAAAEVVQTWTDLYRALVPNDLSKSGGVFGLLQSVPSSRVDPELLALKDDVYASTNLPKLRAYAAARSVSDALPRITTPVEIFQGRRDFIFGLDEGLDAWQHLGGAKRLYIGDFGHAPSTFPGPDAAEVFAEGTRWFEWYLKGGTPSSATPVEVAPDPWTGRAVPYETLPRLATVRTPTVKLNRTLGARGTVTATLKLPARRLETFGAPVVTVTGSTTTQAKQLVAILQAVKGSKTVTISEGGTLLPTGRKRYTVSFALISDVTLVPKGSKLLLTLGWTDGQNLLYLNGVPDGSSLNVNSVYVTLPTLKNAISK